MSDGLAHCRSISVVKIFEMIKKLSNIIFDIVIALRIGIHKFNHARAMDSAKIPFRASLDFSILRQFRENVVTARAESIFTLHGKMFPLCVSNSVTDLLQFHETVL